MDRWPWWIIFVLAAMGMMLLTVLLALGAHAHGALSVADRWLLLTAW
jgi:hypothetical protein